MELIAASPVAADHAADIPELVWATGPVSYEYIFGERATFDALVDASWGLDDSLFGADTTTLAVDGDTLLGIVINMPGAEFVPRRAHLAAAIEPLVAGGDIDMAAIDGVIARSERASWLNPVLATDTSYIHALSVRPEARGSGVGYALIKHVIDRATNAGFAKLQLDVLSDNPAVDFYRAVGLELLVESKAPEPAAHGVPVEYRMGMALQAG